MGLPAFITTADNNPLPLPTHPPVLYSIVSLLFSEGPVRVFPPQNVLLCNKSNKQSNGLMMKDVRAYLVQIATKLRVGIFANTCGTYKK
jgi:hypothetical protein